MEISVDGDSVPLGGDLNWQVRLSQMPLPLSIENNPILLRALNSLIEEGRIEPNLGLELYSVSNLNSLFTLANMVKQSRFENQIFFNQNLHVIQRTFVFWRVDFVHLEKALVTRMHMN